MEGGISHPSLSSWQDRHFASRHYESAASLGEAGSANPSSYVLSLLFGTEMCQSSASVKSLYNGAIRLASGCIHLTFLLRQTQGEGAPIGEKQQLPQFLEQ